MSTLALVGQGNYDPAYSVIIYPDSAEVMSAGTLLLWDGGQSPLSAAPANGTTLPNLAWKTAAAIIGSGDATSLAMPFVNSLSAGEGLVEVTPKKGLHAAVKSAITAQHLVGFSWPAAILSWIYNQSEARSFYFSVWANQTRLATGTSSDFFFAGTSSGSTNKLFFCRQSTGFSPAAAPHGLGVRQATRVVGTPALRSLGVTGFSGTRPGSSGGVSTLACKLGGSGGPDASTENAATPSSIVYRIYAEDLTTSGRSYAQVDALDLAAFTAAFASGGRFNGDTWTDPATQG